MIKRVEALTPAQSAQLTAHADKWIKILLKTGPADRAGFEAAARRCYEHAGIPWHHRVIWTGSPLVLAFAGPIAALQIRLRRRGGVGREKPGELISRDVLREAEQAVGNAVKRAVGVEAHRAVGQGVGGIVSGEVEPVDEAIRAAISAALYRGLSGAARDAGRESIEEATSEVIDSAVAGPVREAILAAIHSAVSGIAGGAGEGMVASGGHRTTRRVIGGVIRTVIRDCWFPKEPVPGGWRKWSPDVTSFFREVCGLELAGNLWDRARAYEQVLSTAHWWYADESFLMVCERPWAIHREVMRRTRGPRSHRLHHGSGAAVSWPDGWGVYSIHGRAVAGWIMEHPERITVAEIERETNAELRRVMIERYGWERYIRDCGAQVVDAVPLDHEIEGLRGARLLRKVLAGEPEPIVYLEMRNSTPEPDGTYRRYLERIDPKAYHGAAGRLCHAAMASRWAYRDETGQLRRTFARWQDYRPTAES
jgi:hypothetical protein